MRSRHEAPSRSDFPLHQHDVDPSPELVAGIVQRADVAEAGAGVQADGRGVAAVADDGDHLPPRARRAAGDQAVQKGDRVFLATGRGTNGKTVESGVTTYTYYWGLREAVWNNDKDMAVLLKVATVQTATFTKTKKKP